MVFDPLLGGASLVDSDEGDGSFAEIADSSDHGAFVAEAPVSVKLNGIREKGVDVFAHRRAVARTRKLYFFIRFHRQSSFAFSESFFSV